MAHVRVFLTQTRIVFVVVMAIGIISFSPIAAQTPTALDCLENYPLPESITVPARNLTTTQALDIVAYLVSRDYIRLVEPEIGLTLNSSCEIVYQQPIYDEHSGDPTSPRIRVSALIAGVHYQYRDSNDYTRSLSNLDPAMVVFLFKLAVFLKTWGVTEVQQLGVGRACNSGCDCGQHYLGRAIDFAGVTGEITSYILSNVNNPYSINVFNDWGMQPVQEPGENPYEWAKGVETRYRLQPVTDLSTPELVHQFLAYSIFQDVYDFATLEAVDTGRSTGTPTTIGQSSDWIIHPDYRTDKIDAATGILLADEHRDHMHIEIGPSCERSS